ncbi:flagellar assembly protein FliW [Oceanispirochaeta sp.]|jgi:flagellar assembly factor FliW|uniref:flagellar assembly protein FliW n=1 Tax=Oceanispirochaeta sp. TaxID=2035350 RepID=UPI00260ABB86|nr:flagellar assembly protein FliW [Oceanispirochaeta sp.]MDA3957026.1 flagellar assembly protein FliW [Oceanispirochaeta sp.]
MQIYTKAYGEVEIDDRQVINFPNGLFGFETLRKFALLDATQQPFYWIQSLDVEQVAFVLIKPVIFRPDYKPGLMSSDLEQLGLKNTNEEDALVFSIVTFLDDKQTMTANLQGPVIINRHKRIGRQCISTDSRWQTRHNIAEELANQRKNLC